MYDDDDNKEDGSVWTSYSDLFTTVAVIFLVMFVFALIKAGVSKMETVVTKRKHESELKGKVTKEVKLKTKKDISKVDSSLKDMEQYENLINDKMKEMNSFVKKLQRNKKVMKDIIKDQSRKEAQLNVVSKKLTEIKSNYHKSKKTNIKLNEKINDKIKKVSELDVLQKQLSKQLKDLKEQAVLANRIIKAKKDKNEELVEKLKTATITIENELTIKENKNKSIKQLDEKLRTTKIDLNETYENLKKERKSKIDYKATLDNEILKASNKVTQQELIIKKLNDEVKLTKDRVKEISTSNRKQEGILKKRELAIKKLTIKEKSNNKQIENLKAIIAVENKNKTIQNSKNKNLQDENNKHKQKEQQFVLSAKSSDTKLEKMSSSIKSFKSKISQMRSLVAKLQNKNNSNNQKLEQSRISHLDLSRQIANEQSSRAKLKKEKMAINDLYNKSKSGSEKLTKNITELKEQIKILGQGKNSVESKSKELASKNKMLKSQLSGLGEQIKGLESENEKLAESNRGQRVELKQVGELGNKLNELRMKNFNQKGKFEAKIGAADQKIQTLSKQLKKMSSSELIASNTAKLCKKNKLAIQKRVSVLEDRQKTLGSQTKKEQDQKKRELKGLALKNRDLLSSNKNLKESLNNFAEKVAGVKGKLRTNIANDLASEFKKANINVFVDNKTGNVVLLMNKNFRFKKNSFQLNLAAKKTLKTIIPIYSKVLFGNSKIQDKIQGFNIIGHASPSYKGRFVKPLADNNTAYSYNMRLSAQRAASITNYIFGNRIGDYSFKRKLKGYTKAIGQGFTKPIKNKKIEINRSLASNNSNCGPYNCHASQRVELSFTLKDDVKSLNNLINMAKEVQE
jgi:chromosome segregation ATPase